MTDNDVRFRVSAEDDASDVLDDVADKVDDTGKKAAKSWKDAEDASKKFTASVAVVATALTAMGAVSVNAAREAVAGQKQLDAVLKSTAGVAGVTKQAALDYANSLSRVTNFTDDNILSGENLLLTFTNIGKDIFPQATETMLNMSAALGQDLKNSAVQLGKALQDPIEGVTALRRVGVNFNDAQQAMIKKLVESGRALDAQKMILKELQTEFGGAARAVADPLIMARNLASELGEAIGLKLLPFLNAAAQAFMNWIDAMGGPAAVIDTISSALAVMAPLLPVIAGAILGGMVPAFYAWAGAIWAIMAPLIPFMAAGAALAALAYVIYQAWSTNFLGMRDAVVNVLTQLQAFFTILVANLRYAWESNLFGIRDTTMLVWDAIKTVVTLAADAILGTLRVFFDILRGDWSAAWMDLNNLAANVMQGILNLWSTVMQAILSAATTAMQALLTIIPNALYSLQAVFSAVWTGIFDFIGLIWAGIVQYAADHIPVLGAFLEKAGPYIAAAFGKMFGGVGTVVAGVFNWVISAVTQALNWIITQINSVIALLNSIPKKFGGGGFSEVSKIAAGGAISAASAAAPDVAAPTMPTIPKMAAPTLGGGGGTDAAKKAEADKKKRDEAMAKEIADNINAIASKRSTALGDRDALQQQIEKIDEELAREKHDGVALNQTLVRKRAELLDRQKVKDSEIATMDKQLQRAEGELAREKRAAAQRQEEEDALAAEFRRIDDMVSAQKLSEADAAEAKRKAEAEKKKRESEAKKAESTNSTSSSSTSVADIAPSTLSGLAGASKASLGAQGIVLLDIQGTGDKNYYIDIHDNEFNGSGEDFAMQVGDIILKKLGVSTQTPAV